MYRNIWILLILAYIGCIPSSSPFIERKEAERLITEIEQVQYSDIIRMNDLIYQLNRYKSNQRIATIADYYQIKSRIFSSNIQSNEKELLEIYDRLKAEGLKKYLAEIDMLLLRMYFISYRLKDCESRLNAASEYMMQPDMKAERAAFIYGFQSVYQDDEVPEKLREIEIILDELKDEPWTMFKAHLYRNFANLLFRDRQIIQADSTLHFIIRQSIDHNLITDAADTYFHLAKIHNSSKKYLDERLYYNMRAIELMEQCGHKNFLDIYYQGLGHSHMLKKNFEKAFAAYNIAHELSENSNHELLIPTMLMYMGWSYFKIDPSRNYDKANEYFTEAENMINNDGIVCRGLTERRQWALGASGQKKAAKIIKGELDKLLVNQKLENSANFNSHLALFKLNNLVELKIQDTKLKKTELENQIINMRIRRLQLLVVFSLLGIGALYFYTRKKAKLMALLQKREEILYATNQELNTQNAIIEKQNQQLTKLIRDVKNSNESLSNFAHVAAHDLKTPLNSMHGMANILLDELSDIITKEQADMLSYLINSSHNLSQMVNGLLDFSRVHSLSEKDHHTVNTNELLEQVVSLIQSKIVEKDVQLTMENSIPPLWGSSQLLAHLFLNIINNAIKFSREDVTPLVDIFYLTPDDEYVSICIRDNGIGIPADQLDSIFQLFSRGNNVKDYEGHGIGLATSKKIVEQHGGRIEVQSKPGKGSTFIITLKRSTEQESKTSSLHPYPEFT